LQNTAQPNHGFKTFIFKYGDKLLTGDTNMALEVGGKSIETDEEGYLSNRDEWNQEIAEAIAVAENLEMSDNHWEVVNFLREYYDEYQIAPAVRVLTKAIGKKLGKDKGNSKYLYELFPYGPAKQACKIAGLPKPTGCV
jgi:tRNA 2-thiouridine synthesizing protein E